MNINAHLVFNGQCKEAFEFYERCLGGKITFMMSYGESPMARDITPQWHTKILHATFAVGDQVFSGADVLSEQYRKPQGFAVVLHIDSEAEAVQVFECLSEHGATIMSLQQTFWAQRFGMLTDQFGIPWMITTTIAS